MSSRERVLAAVRGGDVDRPPFAVWRHFYSKEGAGADALADAMLDWVRRHELDLLKYNPRAHYHAEPWGTRMTYAGDDHPTLLRYAVRATEDWRRLEPVPTTDPVFVEMLDGLRRVRRAEADLPLVMTIFTPLAVCERLAGRERLVEDFRAHPDAVLSALEVVTDTFGAFARACVGAGADGIFLATTQWASRDVTTDDEYRRFARPYDLRVLAAVRGAPLNVLHVCGENARVVELADYPVAALSWNAHGRGNPALAEFLGRDPDRAAIGGISDRAFTAADGARAREEAARCLVETAGRRWIAAGGCTIPTTSTDAAIRAAREALEQTPVR